MKKKAYKICSVFLPPLIFALIFASLTQEILEVSWKHGLFITYFISLIIRGAGMEIQELKDEIIELKEIVREHANSIETYEERIENLERPTGEKQWHY